MKKYFIIAMLSVTAVLFAGCTKDSVPSTAVASNPIGGNWRVASFYNGATEITDSFTGYVFTCNSNGALTIQGHGNTYNCNWNWINDDHSMCNLHIMGCSANSVLWECEEDWDLVRTTADSCYFTTHNPNHPKTMNWVRN
jgi:hypothetical protein